MTETEWLASADAIPMLDILKEASRRKLRLFAVACCRLFWDQLSDQRCREGIEVAERRAEWRVSRNELSAATAALGEVERTARPAEADAAFIISRVAAASALEAAQAATSSYGPEGFEDPEEAAKEGILADRPRQAQLLRDIFGNPFRPVAVESGWLTSTVVQLAQGIYDDRAFDRLPILADALQDAGCDNEALLGHCRDPQLTHVRGCWAVDLLLGKS